MIELQGADELITKLEKFANAENIESAIKQSCLLVERDAKEKAPKGNGELRRSITSKVETSEENIQGVVYTPLFYAPYVEYGTGLFAEGGNGRKDVPWSYKDEKGEWHSTSGMEPQPYLRPALNENRDKILELIKEALPKDD